MNCPAVQDHWLGQTPLPAEPMIRLKREVRHAPLLEKLGCQAFCRGFIGYVLGTVFAKLRVRPFPVRFWPGATRTIKATSLIQLQERPQGAHHPHLAPCALYC